MMISTGAWVCICTTMIVALCGSAAMSEVAGASAAGTLSGALVDVHGDPIADAVVFTANFHGFGMVSRPPDAAAPQVGSLQSLWV